MKHVPVIPCASILGNQGNWLVTYFTGNWDPLGVQQTHSIQPLQERTLFLEVSIILRVYSNHFGAGDAQQTKDPWQLGQNVVAQQHIMLSGWQRT